MVQKFFHAKTQVRKGFLRIQRFLREVFYSSCKSFNLLNRGSNIFHFLIRLLRNNVFTFCLDAKSNKKIKA
jgi:hypothetical protein